MNSCEQNLPNYLDAMEGHMYTNAERGHSKITFFYSDVPEILKYVDSSSYETHCIPVTRAI
jgi:hypothetical protein